MIKPTKRNAVNAIQRIGATIDWNGDGLTLDAPKGQVFNANGDHSYFVGYTTRGNYGVYEEVTMPMLWEDAIEAAKRGVRECDGTCPNPADWHEDYVAPPPSRAELIKHLAYLREVAADQVRFSESTKDRARASIREIEQALA
jgi:hypothetical protein